MKADASPGPNSFGVHFLKLSGQLSREIIWELDIKRLNYGVITLVPNIREANNINQYRPICLLNVDFKGFTKALTNRLIPLATKVIGSTQTGFIRERNILEGVQILHEVVHELKRSKGKGLILKIDFEKAYAKVR
jgi:hypothetical protein